MTRAEENRDVLRRRVIAMFFAGLILMAIVAVGIGQAFSDWGAIRLGWLNHVSGAALGAGGAALVVWSVWVQYTTGGGTPAPMVATQRLVTNGPYAYTRNPMTLGALLIYLGIGIWMGSGPVIALTVIVFSGLLTYIYIHETVELSERFGESYQEYKRKTPFLFPRFRRLPRR